MYDKIKTMKKIIVPLWVFSFLIAFPTALFVTILNNLNWEKKHPKVVVVKEPLIDSLPQIKIMYIDSTGIQLDPAGTFPYAPIRKQPKKKHKKKAKSGRGFCCDWNDSLDNNTFGKWEQTDSLPDGSILAYPILTESGLDTFVHTKIIIGEVDKDTFGLRAIQDLKFKRQRDSILHVKH